MRWSLRLVGLVVLACSAWARPADAQRVEPFFFGGAGDQRGTAIAASARALYATGSAGGQGLVVKYVLPLSAPAWSALTPASTAFEAIAVSAGDVFAGGGAFPPACGAADGSGGTEWKVGLARLTTAGALTACQSTNFWVYRGTEGYYGAASAVEDTARFFYLGGGGENCGFGHAPFVLAKYAPDGTMVNRVTEPGVSFTGFNCVGGSHVFGVDVAGGFVYASGYSQLTGQGEDAVTRPTVMKYDAALGRVWKARDTTAGPGVLRSVAVREGDLFAAGYAFTVGMPGSEQYLLQKYDVAGNLVWSRTWGSPQTDVLTAVAATPRAVWVVGYTYAPGYGGADATIQEIDPLTGRVRRSLVWGGAQDDFARGVAVSGLEVFAVGESRSFAVGGNAFGQNDMVILRYRRD